MLPNKKIIKIRLRFKHTGSNVWTNIRCRQKAELQRWSLRIFLLAEAEEQVDFIFIFVPKLNSSLN